jgi:hypothetical protein
MATTIRFREHDEFQRAAVHMAVSGALAGLASHVIGLLFPGFGPAFGPWGLALLMAATAFGAVPSERRGRVGEILLHLGALGLVGLALRLTGDAGREATLGAAVFAVVFGALVARGLKGRRFIITMLTAAGVALVARFVLIAFASSGALARLPPWVVAAVAGAAFAFVGVLALLGRHIDVGQDRIEEAYEACRPLSGEIRELADRAMRVWKQVETSIPEDAAPRKAMEQSVLRLFEVARRWHAVESDGARQPIESLVERMEAISDKMSRTEDAIAKAQYERAHAALGEQLRYVKEIGTARERVVARMHHYIAAMERLRLALVNHRSADASRISTEVQPILEDLDDLGKDIDFASQAIGEVEKDEEARRPVAQA